MKHFFYLFCAGVLMSALCAVFNESSAQTKTWDYPVKPGTPEWVAFTTHSEMVKACQIPESILSALKTKELVELCLNYPLFGDVYAYNSLQNGFINNTVADFNGIQDLFRRKDNVQCLLDILKSNDLMEMQSRESISTTLQVGESISRHSFLEVLLSHESIIAATSLEQQKEIARITAKNILVKESMPHLYSQQGLESSAYLLGTTLKKENPGITFSPDLEQFLNEGSTLDAAIFIEELIVNHMKF